MLDKSSRFWRARKARAIRYGDDAIAAEADLALRAARIAKTIKNEVRGAPFPPAVVAELAGMLVPAGGERVGN